MSIDVAALTFDTGGTILDWHSGISGALRRIGDGHGLDRPWAEIANDYDLEVPEVEKALTYERAA